MLPKGAAAKVSQHPTELHLEARNLGVACVVDQFVKPLRYSSSGDPLIQDQLPKRFAATK